MSYKKVEKVVSVQVCDNCQKEESCTMCPVCGAMYCYDCKKAFLTEVRAELHIIDHYQHYICHKCMDNPPKWFRPLHTLYLAEQRLALEADAQYVALKKRDDELRAEIHKMHDELEARFAKRE